jgi:four helix bundle protein
MYPEPVKDLKVYHKAFELSITIYRITKDFPKEELFGLTSQIRRCAVSIPSNIAEGKGRYIQGDYCRFLAIARGSLFELQTQIAIARELNYLTQEEFTKVYQLSEEIGKMLTAIINRLSPKA